MQENNPSLRQRAFQFIILLGFVSLFADIAYEGARSITGPYLAVLGASGAVVGFVAGFGELIGYAMRMLSGFVSDKTGRYWPITILGYCITLVAVPMLALATRWETAAGLIIMERFGKAIRTPPRDAMLSYATHETGRGLGFGLHTAIDRIGGMIGPLAVTLMLYLNYSYRSCFAFLLVPVIVTLGFLLLARLRFPNPKELEVSYPQIAAKGFTQPFWIYVAGASLVAAGYVDFSLIAFHFQKTASFPPLWFPMFYALALGIASVSALVFGRLFDKAGIPLLMGLTGCTALFAPLVFLGDFIWAFVGMGLWGIGMGVQESIMTAIVAHLIPPDKRGTGYGVYNMCFGIFWFLGSFMMGILYDTSLPAMITLSVAAQLGAIPFFGFLAWKKV